MLKLDVLAAELNLWANETEQIYRATKEIKYRGDAKHLRYLAATLNQSSLPSTGVTSFNTRVGDVVLSSLDVTTALGYNPVTQARTLTINGVTYDLSANRSWTISTAIPTLAQVTTAGNTTTNAITVGGLTVATNLIYTDTVGGRVGIGTTGLVPGILLTINGSVLIAAGQSLKLDPTANIYIVAASTQFRVYTGAIAALAIPNTGNVLINTTTDAGYKLDVNGTIRASGAIRTDAGNTVVALNLQGSTSYIQATPSNGTSNIVLNSQSSSLILSTTANSFADVRQGYAVQHLRIGQADSSYGGDLRFYMGNSGGMFTWSINAGGAEVMRLPGTGNLLIGTTTDSGYKLDVNGTARVKGTGTTSATTAFLVQNSAGDQIGSFRDDGQVVIGKTTGAYITAGNLSNFYNTSAGYGHIFRVAGTEVVRIEGTGNVGIGTSTVPAKLNVTGSITAASALAQGVFFNNTLVAAANNDVLVGLDINPTFTNGAFTGVDNWDLRTRGKVLVSSTSTGNVFPLVVRSANYPGILLQNASTGTNHSAAPYDGFAFWINYDVSHAKGLITNYENNGISIYNGTNPATGLTIFGSTNNVAINSTTDVGEKLHVVGNISITNGRYKLGGAQVGIYATIDLGLTVNTSGGGSFLGYYATGDTSYLGTTVTLGRLSSVNLNATSGLQEMVRITGNYAPTSGTGLFTALQLSNTINQTGGANGITRGLYINPTITSAADFRAIETTVGNVLLCTTSGNVGIGTTNPTVKLHIVGNEYILNAATASDINFYTTPGITNHFNFYNLRQNSDFIFKQNVGGAVGTSTVIIKGLTGNVLVGTTTDAGYKLDVNGTARVKTDLKIETGTGGLTIEGDASGYPTLLINTLRSGVDRRNWKFATEQVNVGDFIFYRSSTGGGAANTVVYAISKDGNFGLGTSTPTDKFHIVDNTNGNKFARISAGGTDASAAWVAQNDQVDNVVYRVFGSGVTGTQMGQALARSASLLANLGGTGKFLIGTYSSTDLIFGTGDQARMRLVDSTGNFLIGTMTDTGNKLTVSGNIDAQGYKVNNVLGFTGIFNVPTNPPGSQNLDIQGGIIVNVF